MRCIEIDLGTRDQAGLPRCCDENYCQANAAEIVKNSGALTSSWLLPLSARTKSPRPLLIKQEDKPVVACAALMFEQLNDRAGPSVDVTYTQS